MGQPLFVSVSFSPWSERARFALDHHGIDYRKEEYLPFLGEPLLRLRTRVFRGQLTLPVLFHDGLILRDSVAIARYADQIGDGAPLFPVNAGPQLQEYVDLATEVMEAGRVLGQVRMRRNPEVLRELVPPAVPGPLRPALMPLLRVTTAYIGRKYRLQERDPSEARETIHRHLARFQRELRGRGTLLSGFTFADMTVAVAVGVLRPVDHPAVRIGGALRAAFGMPDLAEEFGDLIEWRDRIYAERRPIRA
ncbi:MAG TPA: glutathione S-transferase N-terminal domain-containing protein [Polyangia bacterium]|jgi:glutathione S-transferase|nr:glutathione S-transferase N-terminal domain-containing protein [Polyangia bacterium]